MFKKAVAGSAACVAVLVGAAAPATAHQHAIRTPGGNVVTMACEPFHGTTPGASEHSVNWDAARGLHPLHWGLHKAPSEQERAITVEVVATDCP